MHNSSLQTGWVAGGGVEYAFAANWMLRLEYQHLDLGGYTLSAPVLPAELSYDTVLTTNSLSHAYDTVRVGVNYRFP